MSVESADYSVKFGRNVRTLEYHDLHVDLRFTFDVSAPKVIVLDHHSPSKPRGDRYSMAFERIKQYLEFCGYQVQVEGS